MRILKTIYPLHKKILKMKNYWTATAGCGFDMFVICGILQRQCFPLNKASLKMKNYWTATARCGFDMFVICGILQCQCF